MAPPKKSIRDESYLDLRRRKTKQRKQIIDPPHLLNHEAIFKKRRCYLLHAAIEGDKANKNIKTFISTQI